METETTWEYRLQNAVRWQTEDAINDVIYFIKNKVITPEWIDIKNGIPSYGQRCWVTDKNGDLYLAIFKQKYTFFGKPNGGKFLNLLGKQWPLSNIIKWTPLILPANDKQD